MYMNLMTAEHQATAEGFLVDELKSVSLLPVGKMSSCLYPCFVLDLNVSLSTRLHCSVQIVLNSVLGEGGCIVSPATLILFLSKA